MQQWGLKINSSPQIDDLGYVYSNSSYSNKLMKVTDGFSDPVTKLGDFKDGTNGASDDYSYDINGNLIADANKNIAANQSGNGIQYNHLNLPSLINVFGKGQVEYVYDAAGNKLKKISSDNATGLTTTTLYISGVVYENDALQFAGHEEGRIRYKPVVGSNPAEFAYDYFVKDHLGNVRMVLTEQAQTDAYPAATMETTAATTEETFYSNLHTTRVDAPTHYPPNSPSGNAKVAKTGGGAGLQKIGPAIILKVMAGDKFNVSVNSWYKTSSGQTPNTPVGILNTLLSALSSGVGGLAGSKASEQELNNAGAFNSGATSFLTNQTNSGSSSRPWAFLNWILFDEQFNMVSSSSGFEQVYAESEYNNGSYPNNNTKLHVHDDMPIDKSGFLYIYVSNETPNIDVFFDNLQVTHIRGQILEETHYYPFGLTMAGISSKAAGSLENKIQKFQCQEFTNDFDISMYEFKYRMDDCQIGRFWQIDPLSEKYVYNSTYAFSENKVTSHVELEGLETLGVNELKTPALRAMARENVQREVKQFNKNASEAAEIKVTLGPGFSLKAQAGNAKFEAGVNGTQASVTASSGGKVKINASAASAGGEVSAGPLSVKAGGKLADVEFSESVFKTDIIATGGSVQLSSSQKVGDDKLSGKGEVDYLDYSLSAGAHIGLVGVSGTVNLVKTAAAVVGFFTSLAEYSKERIKEDTPSFLGGYASPKKQ